MEKHYHWARVRARRDSVQANVTIFE